MLNNYLLFVQGVGQDEDVDAPPSALPYPIAAPHAPPNLLFGTDLAEPADLSIPYQDLFNTNA